MAKIKTKLNKTPRRIYSTKDIRHARDFITNKTAWRDFCHSVGMKKTSGSTCYGFVVGAVKQGIKRKIIKLK